jgi:hypothetical protein
MTTPFNTFTDRAGNKYLVDDQTSAVTKIKCKTKEDSSFLKACLWFFVPGILSGISCGFLWNFFASRSWIETIFLTMWLSILHYVFLGYLICYWYLKDGKFEQKNRPKGVNPAAWGLVSVNIVSFVTIWIILNLSLHLIIMNLVYGYMDI